MRYRCDARSLLTHRHTVTSGAAARVGGASGDRQPYSGRYLPPPLGAPARLAPRCKRRASRGADRARWRGLRSLASHSPCMSSRSRGTSMARGTGLARGTALPRLPRVCHFPLCRRRPHLIHLPICLHRLCLRFHRFCLRLHHLPMSLLNLRLHHQFHPIPRPVLACHLNFPRRLLPRRNLRRHLPRRHLVSRPRVCRLLHLGVRHRRCRQRRWGATRLPRHRNRRRRCHRFPRLFHQTRLLRHPLVPPSPRHLLRPLRRLLHRRRPYARTRSSIRWCSTSTTPASRS